MAVGSRLLSRSTRRFSKEYELCQLIGKGSFGEVWICRDRWSGREFAAKLIDKATLRTPAEREDVQREIGVMEAFAGKHPGVVHLHEVLEGDSVVQLVMELCSGGDLFELLKSRGNLPEEGAKVLFRQLASAIAFCHSHGVIHRDIKPENILLEESGLRMYEVFTPVDEVPPVKIKLADFGLAAVLGPEGLASGYTGSRYYTAPEMLKGELYGRGADVWSLGVVLCTMLTGRLPFAGQNKQDIEGLRRSILRGKINFYQPSWEAVSDSAKHLVMRMLAVDPKARIAADELLTHPWLAILEEGNSSDRATGLFLPGFASQSLPGSPVDTHRDTHALRPYSSAGPEALSQFRLPPPHVEHSEPPLQNVPLNDTEEGGAKRQQEGGYATSPANSPASLQRSPSPEPMCCVVPMALSDFSSAGVWCFPHLMVPGWGDVTEGEGQQLHKEHAQQPHGGMCNGALEDVTARTAPPQASLKMQAPPSLELGKPHRVLAPLLEFFAY